MPCVFLLLCVIQRPQSPTPFKKVRYSLTQSNRENWGGLSRSKFNFSVVSSFAVQLSDNISEIWSSIIFFKGEIAIIQVFDEDMYFWAIAKTVMIMLLTKPVDKIAITSLLWRRLYMAIPFSSFNTTAFFSCRIFKIDNASVNASLIFWFCLSKKICSVTWNFPMGDYQIFDWRANILIQSQRSVRRRTYFSKKSFVCAGGFSLLPSQSPGGFFALARHLIIPLGAQPKPPCCAG